VNYALVGFGKMGRAIDAAASARGHRRRLIVDREARGTGIARSLGVGPWRGIAVAFEFTEPEAAREHVIALLRGGLSVVCGTTGWDATDPEVRRAARGSRAGAVIAPNFSVGMNLFYAVVREAAAVYLAVDDYDPWVAEWHHRAKRDAPSGTARRISEMLAAAAPRRAPPRVRGTQASSPREIPVVSVRAGAEPGRHVVGFDGAHDAVTLTHVARGRDAFALGAVLAAEWVHGRRGLHGFDEVVDDLVRKGGRRGGRR